MNLVVLSGRLATEPSLKYLKESGIPVSKFNLAVQKNIIKMIMIKSIFSLLNVGINLLKVLLIT